MDRPAEHNAISCRHRLPFAAAMAAPIAYEQPSINRAWRAFVDHLPVLAVVLASLLGIGVVAAIVIIPIVLVIGLLGTPLTGSMELSLLIGQLVGYLGQIPFYILYCLVQVLFTAVPAMHYESGLTITPGMAFQALGRRWQRFLLAGLLFTVVSVVGFLLCVVPGIAVCLVGPVYVNRIFNTNESITDAFSRSFQAVFRSERGMNFVIAQLLAFLVVIVLTICTCGLGGLVFVPMAMFYIQNSAYYHGVLS